MLLGQKDYGQKSKKKTARGIVGRLCAIKKGAVSKGKNLR